MSIEWTDEERDALYDAIEETHHSEFEPMTVILDALAPFVAAREKAAEQRGAAQALREVVDEYDEMQLPLSESLLAYLNRRADAFDES